MIFKYPYRFELESGDSLSEIQLEYQTWGTLNADCSNVIWVCHALTANSEATDWWSGLVGFGKLFDPSKHFIVCANMLGSYYGSTYALSENPATGKPYYHTFPNVTVQDMAKSLDLLRNHLGISKVKVLIGGSMGGQQALEWAIQQPEVFEHLIPIATNAQHSPWGIAFNESQRLAIQADSTWQEESPTAGMKGLQAARAMAMVSYRNYETYQATQTDIDTEKIDKFSASSYQSYQGEKLTHRFDAFAYWTLSKAMDSHNVGRGRNGVEHALNQIRAKTLVIGITSDVLFPLREQVRIAKHIPNAQFASINSTYGHDGFLIEFEEIGRLIGGFLDSGVEENEEEEEKGETTILHEC